jgi:hypothetical protein
VAEEVGELGAQAALGQLAPQPVEPLAEHLGRGGAQVGLEEQGFQVGDVGVQRLLGEGGLAQAAVEGAELLARGGGRGGSLFEPGVVCQKPVALATQLGELDPGGDAGSEVDHVGISLAGQVAPEVGCERTSEESLPAGACRSKRGSGPEQTSATN